MLPSALKLNWCVMLRPPSTVQAMVYRLENDRDALQAETDRLAERFDLETYGQAMTRLYQGILN